MEWRLFEEGTVPFYTTAEFFAAHPWIPPELQHGHRERTEMAARVIRGFVAEHSPTSLVDLGCGDGSLLNLIRDLPIPMWGYDAGEQNIAIGQANGLDTRRTDLIGQTPIEWGDLIVATEMIEHLVDPHSFVRDLPGNKLVLTSPSAETGDWHYEHHAWAWDLDGYRELAEGAGWTVTHQEECDATATWHNGIYAPQRFQALTAVR